MKSAATILSIIIIISGITSCRSKKIAITAMAVESAKEQIISKDSITSSAKESVTAINNISEDIDLEFEPTGEPFNFYQIVGKDTLQSIQVSGGGKLKFKTQKVSKDEAIKESAIDVKKTNNIEVVKENTQIKEEVKTVKKTGFQFGVYIIIVIIFAVLIAIYMLWKFMKKYIP